MKITFVGTSTCIPDVGSEVASSAFTGDTSFHPPIADFAKGLPLLVVEV